MNLRLTPCSLASLVILLLCAPGGAQQPKTSGLPGAQTDASVPGVVSLSELVLDRYRVMHVSAQELFKLAHNQIGREYFVKENGPGSKPVSSMQMLGGAIVLYDAKEQVQRAREFLAKLDVPREQQQTTTKVVEYRPRFVSLNTVQQAVDDLVELNVVEERGLIVMADGQAEIDRALELLARIDVAEKQVLLTCLLVDVGASAHGVALPRELSENLQKLLPDVQFAQVGMAMLKTSVSSRDQIALEIESPGLRDRLSLLPVAFDQATGTLTVSECRLIEGTDEDSRELFRTDTLLRGGEYTVLAATGDSPRLLVVRVTPQG